MKLCWHNYKDDKSREISQIISLDKSKKGRWVKTLWPEICIKCDKQRYWGFGWSWVWNGEQSFTESILDVHKTIEEIRKNTKEATKEYNTNMDTIIRIMEKNIENTKKIKDELEERLKGIEQIKAI